MDTLAVGAGSSFTARYFAEFGDLPLDALLALVARLSPEDLKIWRKILVLGARAAEDAVSLDEAMQGLGSLLRQQSVDTLMEMRSFVDRALPLVVPNS